MSSENLYNRLGGYDAMVAVVDDLLRGSKPMRSSGVFGSTGAKMAFFVKGSC